MNEESHERSFRGVWIPAWIFDMFEDEENNLRPKDILMYANIDSLYDKKKGGCWASNAYLGKRTGVSEDLAGRVVNKLIHLGMVNNVGFDGRRRYLVVCYDKETGERVRKSQPASGERGKQLRGNGGSSFGETPDAASGKPPTKKQRENKGRTKEEDTLCPSKKSSDPTNGTSSLFDDKQDSVPSSSKTNGSSRRGKKKQPSAFDEKAASKFAEVVKTHRKVQKNSDLRQWANTFRQMREIDKVSEKDIREVITWYGKHIGGDFIPEAFSAATFRKKYAEGKFTSAMRRCSQGNGTSSNGGKRLTRENMWSDPENMLPGGILKTEVGQDGQKYDGQVLDRVRRQVLKRFGQGLPLPEELQMVLDEEFPGVETLPVAIIGRVG